MGLESLLDPPEPDQFTGTKRLSALSDVGHQTKRLCTSLSELPPGSAALELSNGYNFWGESSVATNLEFGNAALQYSVDPEIDWSNAVPSGILVGLDSAPNPLASGSGPFLFDSMPSQMRETTMQSSPEADRLYHQPEIQGSTNMFDLHYSFDANKIITPSVK